MAPTKRFAKYTSELRKAIALLEAAVPSKHTKQALTILTKVAKSTAKYAGEESASGSAAKKPRKLNNYMLFVKENRAKVAASMGAGTKVTEVAKRLGEMWREVKDTWKPKKSSSSSSASSTASSKRSSSSKKSASPKPKKASAAKAKKPASAAKPKKAAKKPKAPKKTKAAASFYDFF